MWSTDAAARLRGIAITMLALTGASACSSLSGGGYDEAKPATPTQQYSIKVEETPERMAVTPHADGLSPAQRVALIGFVARWRDATAAGDIAVQAPSGGDQAAVQRTASEIMGALQALGVPSQQVRTGDYAAPAGAERVLVSYSSLEAKVDDCSKDWSNLTSTGGNEVSEHFGCAVTSNMAAMIADPRDLISPKAMTPADAARRATVLAKYRDGQITSTARDEQAAATISGAVK